MKRLLSMWVIFTLTGGMMLTTEAQAPDAPTEIVETVEIEPNVETLLKNRVRYTKHWDEGTTDNTVEINYQDAQLLMMVASAEALNQGTEGMKKVMEVILNRAESPEFPNTIQEVIYQKGAFETVTTGAIYNAQITPEVRAALAEIEKNLASDNDIVAFETTSNGKSLTRYFDYLYTLGAHDFYQSKKD